MYIYHLSRLHHTVQLGHAVTLYWRSVHVRQWSVSNMRRHIVCKRTAWPDPLSQVQHVTCLLLSVVVLCCLLYRNHARSPSSTQPLPCRVIKTLTGEQRNTVNQARLMGYMTMGWGAGTIAGPLIGGALANPCNAFCSGFALCGPNQLFQTRYDKPEVFENAMWTLCAYCRVVCMSGAVAYVYQSVASYARADAPQWCGGVPV